MFPVFKLKLAVMGMTWKANIIAPAKSINFYLPIFNWMLFPPIIWPSQSIGCATSTPIKLESTTYRRWPRPPLTTLRLSPAGQLMTPPAKSFPSPSTEGKHLPSLLYFFQNYYANKLFILRENGPTDVTIKVLFCGMCHTDLHHVKNDWGITMYPVVPG